MDKENKELVPVKEGFFSKIKNFFNGLFKKKEIVKEENKEEAIQDEIVVPKKEEIFKEELAVSKDEERERLLRLQEKFKRGEIVKGELSNEDIEKLSNLYDEQIEEIQKRITNKEILIKKYKERRLRKQAGNA